MRAGREERLLSYSPAPSLLSCLVLLQKAQAASGQPLPRPTSLSPLYSGLGAGRVPAFASFSSAHSLACPCLCKQSLDEAFAITPFQVATCFLQNPHLGL